MEIQSNEMMLMNTTADLSISLLIEAVGAGKPGRNQNGNLSIACALTGAKL